MDLYYVLRFKKRWTSLTDYVDFCSVLHGLQIAEYSITYECIISFIKIVSLVSPGTIDKVATALSKYMRSLVDNNLVFDDISHLIKVNRVKNEKIRKAADVNDIAKILDTVDRNSAMGKRDYAIIVLACTTGIRC